MADELDAISILITAEDNYSKQLDGMDESTRSFVDNTEEYLKGAKEFANEMTKAYLDDLQTIADIEKAKETASESELIGLQKIQDEYKKTADVKKTAADNAIASIIDEEQALADLIEAHKAGNQAYVEDIKRRDKVQTESLRNIRRGGVGASRALGGIKSALGAAGIQFGKATKASQRFGRSNLETFSQMNTEGSAVEGMLTSIAGIDYGQTIQGLTSLGEQLEEMKKISAQGKGISGMMKLNLAMTGLQALEPLVKGIVDYFRDAEGMAKLSEAASQSTQKSLSAANEYQTDRIRMAKEMMAVMGDTEEAQKLADKTAVETSQKRIALDQEIAKYVQKEKDRWLGKGLFHAQAMKDDDEQLASLREQLKVLNEITSVDKKAEAHAQRMKDLNTAKGYRDQTEALQENLKFLRQQNRENLTEYEIGIRRMRAKMVKDGRDVTEIDAYNKLLDEQKDLQEKIAEQQAKRDGSAAKDELTPFDKLMKEREAHFDKHEKYMDRYEDQLKKQFKTTKELRKEELERLNINPKMIEKITEQEEAMRKLKEAGISPENDVEAGNISRLSAGQTTDKMTEAERKTAAHQKEIEKLARDQLEELKKDRKNTVEFKEYKG